MLEKMADFDPHLYHGNAHVLLNAGYDWTKYQIEYDGFVNIKCTLGL